MFRMGLLTSTAMTAVALLLSGARAQAQTGMHAADPDANARFLCTYGQFRVSFYYSRSQQSNYHFSAWERVAVPIVGHGQTVNRIIVMEAQASLTSNSAFSAGIYSNNAKGFPGKRIAGGKGNAGPSCGPVKISIRSTVLNPGTKYWIEEKAGHVTGASSFTAVEWAANPNAKGKAYLQTHFRHCLSDVCSSSTSPWTQQSSGPFFKLK